MIFCLAFIHADELEPEWVGEAPVFNEKTFAEFSRRDSMWDAGQPVWNKVYRDGVSFASLTDDEKELFEVVDVPYERPRSIFDIRHQVYGDLEISAISHFYKASSTLGSTSRHSYELSNLADCDLSTAWVEGDPEYGIGVQLYFTVKPASWVADTYPSILEQDTNYLAIYINNGYVKSDESWRNNSRIKTFNICRETGEVIHTVFLRDTAGVQMIRQVPFPADVYDVNWYIEIIEVFPGLRWKDTAISELRIQLGG